MTIHTDMFFHGNYTFSVRADAAGPVVYVHERGREPYTCDARVLLYELRPDMLRELADELEAAIAEWVKLDGEGSPLFGRVHDTRDDDDSAF